MKYDISRIVVEKRKRDLGDISPLAHSIKEIGLLNPITIKPDGTLIAGLHRLEACKSLGWSEVETTIVDLQALNAELAEIDENLIRNELKEIEQARHLQRRKEIYETIHQETKHGGDRKSSRQIGDLMPRFSEDTSKKTGKSERTVQRSTQIAKNIAPALDQAILTTPIADSQKDLLALARCSILKRQYQDEARTNIRLRKRFPQAHQHLQKIQPRRPA